jgi:2-oxoglutarate ferredoxin oxidoreductase subunit beta
MASALIEKYMRTNNLPHIWCSGCGNGILMRNIAQAIDNIGLSHDDVVVVSGIGCSSRAAGYLDFNTLHTTHGRAIAFATGVKMANPDLEVIVVTGDGDCSAIGGNHLIHAARRNIGLTVVVFNNNIYGMTGGQFSPTTPTGDAATTAPYGNIDRSFDLAALAYSAGATYAARGNCYHVRQTTKLIEQGIRHKGFSIIDCASICPTYYGRKNGKGGPVEMMRWQKENSILQDGFDAKTSSVESRDKLVVGLLAETEYPEFSAEYRAMVKKMAEGSGKNG